MAGSTTTPYGEQVVEPPELGRRVRCLLDVLDEGNRSAFARRLDISLPKHLALDDHFLCLPALPGLRLRGGSHQRPDDQEVRSHPAEAVFALDPAPAVDDVLEERLQRQLRPGLPVLETLHPVLRMLAEELLERGQQLADPQSARTLKALPPTTIALQN